MAVFLFLTKADVSTPHRDLKGVVVTLSNEGHLQCSYMGTDPSFFSTPKVDAREQDYSQIDTEMKSLQRVIRQATRTQAGRTHTHTVNSLCVYLCIVGYFLTPSLS